MHPPLDGRASQGVALFGGTAGSQLTFRGVRDGAAVDGTPPVSIWFTVGWRLAGGTQASFDVLDVPELAGDGRIAAVHIVDDASGIRPAFEEGTRRRSRRADLPGDAWAGH